MTSDRRDFLVNAGAALLGTAAASVAGAAAAQPATGSAVGVPTGAVSRFAQINGLRMHYVTMGSGPLLLFLHGWPQTWFAWREMMPRFANRYTVIVPDLRGNGLTEVTPAGYDKQTIANDLRALIVHAGAAKAHVVGHDMGGKAAYVLAHLHPDNVATLTLVDCLIPGTENMDALRGGAWHYGFHMAPDLPEMLTRGRERDYISAQIKAWSQNKDAISDAAIDEFARHYAGPGRMTAGFNYYRALRQDAPFVATLRGRKLAMPVMAITGRYGVGDKLKDALTSEATSLTSFVVESSGHFVAEEVPDVFFEKVSTFLESRRGAP